MASHTPLWQTLGNAGERRPDTNRLFAWARVRSSMNGYFGSSAWSLSRRMSSSVWAISSLQRGV